MTETTVDSTIEIPKGLSRLGRRAAQTILRVMQEQAKEMGSEFSTGGCKLFYSPKEWKDRGEEYGTESLLVVVHDGGDAAYWFNYDYMAYSMIDKMTKELQEKLNVYAEQCTCWYTAIYAC